MHVCIGPVLEEGRLKLIKTIYHLINLLMETLEIFCFISVMCVTCVSL